MEMEQRRSPRAQVTLALVLKRAKGGPVSGRTIDVGAGGAKVKTDRPLRVDELLAFDLIVDDPPPAVVPGRCRVLREQGSNCYALRFESVDAAAIELLTGGVARTA